MFEFLTKINIIFNLIKFLREYRFLTISILLFLLSTFVFAVGIVKYRDNSIHIDNIEDDKIKDAEEILKNAIKEIEKYDFKIGYRLNQILSF